MTITIIILVLLVAFFMSGKIRSDLVMLYALVLLILFSILTPEETLSGFSNSVVIMMIDLFVVGGAIFQTGLAKVISSRILKFAGRSELKLFVLIILAIATIGTFVSNTGTVALMLPIVVGMAVSANINVNRLLMPLAFASSIGDMMTLIGTPPNLVIQNALIEAGHERLSFFTFAPMGLVCVTVSLIVLIPLSKIFLMKKTDKETQGKHKNKLLQELAGECQLSRDLYKVGVEESSGIVGKIIRELGIPQGYHVTVLGVHRRSISPRHFFKTKEQGMTEVGALIEAEGIPYILGEFENVKRFVSENHLTLLDTHKTEGNLRNTDEGFGFQEIGIAEISLLPTASLIDKPVKASGFKESYSISILGIQRKRDYLLKNLKDKKMHSGDVLLIQGSWANIARFGEDQSQRVVLGQPLTEAAKVTLNHEAPVAALIMLGMIVTMIFDLIPMAPMTAVIVAALLMVLTGCFRNVEEAYKAISQEGTALTAGMLSMSLALEKTEASEVVSQSLVNGLGTCRPFALLVSTYFTTSLVAMFISSTATAVLLAPIALHSAVWLGLSLYPFLFAVTAAASMYFASPFSMPPDALMMPAGRYTFMDYVKAGLPLQIIMGVVIVFVLPLLFPF